MVRIGVTARAFRLFLLVVLVAGLAGCGGGGGVAVVPPPGSGDFLTADARGFFGGPSLPPRAGAIPEEPALDAAQEIAREIEEADLYRISGDLLFLLNPHRGFAIADLAQAVVRGRVPFVGFPREMYLRGDRVLVLVDGFSDGAELLDLDVSDPDNPSLRARLPINGWLRTSRLVGDLLYVVAGDKVLSFAVGTDVTAAAEMALPFFANFVHATDTWLFISGAWNGNTTRVAFVDISDLGGALLLRGSIDLAGYVADDFKMHFGAGTLRVVTHDWVDRGLSRLFMIDITTPSSPQVVGTLELARGEQLFATRFTDEEAYIVTFFIVDPLWVVDLRDPTNPTVAGELIVPGWSTHIVPLENKKLVGLGVDPADGWSVTVSLFDVSDPANPTLQDREDFGRGWSSAFSDVKGFGVFPGDGLVLVPFAGEENRLAVIDLGASTLSLRGWIDASGGVQRGFPHPQGLCALTTEEVVIADPATLAVTATITIAENVVDAARLPDGRLLQLTARGQAADLGGVAIPLSPECMHVSGFDVAVLGWDDQGRAAFVVDFAQSPPALSPRLGLGGEKGPAIPGPWGLGAPGAFFFGFGPLESILTPGGRLYVRGMPSGIPDVIVGGGENLDGFTVLDLPSARRVAGILVRGSFVTGFAAAGEDLAFTHAYPAGPDLRGLPMLRHYLSIVDPAAGTATEPLNVPGYLVALQGDLLFTVEETWMPDFSYTSALVASRLAGTEVNETSRLALPDGVFDIRAAGATLFFQKGGGNFVPLPFDPIDDFGGGGGRPIPADGAIVPGVPVGGGGTAIAGDPTTGSGAAPSLAPDIWEPWDSEIGTVRLGAALAFGPTIVYEESFASLLLAEDGAALVVKDGVIVERWDVTGAAAVKDWSADTGAYPWRARADTIPGQYLVALGYAGLSILP